MAQLIPSFVDEKTPPGERDVFNMLAAGPANWVALHSLDLAPWNRGLRTEIDFVVIIPDSGILCIEVKSHPNISFDGHQWYPASIRRPPFKQALDGAQAFYRSMATLKPEFRHIPVVHCCIFPRARFDIEPNLSVQPWELIDLRAFTRFRNGDDFCEELRLRIRQGIAADRRLPQLRSELSTQAIQSLVALCVPVQRRRPDARQEIEQREREIDAKLREQQRPVFRLAAENERMIVSGGAGTGKTLIAMEVARRTAERGLRVALVCFNQLVGEWIRVQMAQSRPALPQLVVGRAIRVLAEMAAINIPRDPSRQFWDSELPSALMERLTDSEVNAGAQFDVLIVDEAQDILARRWLWDCLVHVVSGGLTGGSVVLFGDFQNQVLSDAGEMRAGLSTFEDMGHPVRYTLVENCRNYRIVGDTAVRLSGIDPSVYAGYLRTGGGISSYDIFFFPDDSTQLGMIAQWLKDLKAQGYKDSEITLLSFTADDRSAAVRLAATGLKLRPARLAGDSTAYASVQAYKGIENKAVILTDVALQDREFHRWLFYTGMTRATECVRVACQRDSQEKLRRWLSGGPEQ